METKPSRSIRQAAQKKLRTNLAAFKRVDEKPLRPARQQPLKRSLAKMQRQFPLNFVVMLARVECIEISYTINTEHNGFAIEYNALLADLSRGLHDPRIAAGPVVPTPADQTHAIIVSLQAKRYGAHERGMREPTCDRSSPGLPA